MKNNIESIYPLSPMQQGMLFHTLYAPESAMYFEQFTYHLQGKLNVTAFQKAWQQVAERHSVLRTAIVWEDLDESLQVVREQVEMPWSLHDWQDLAPAEQAIRLENFLGADRKQGFELSTAPLMRLALIHVTENEYWFIWSFHHLLLDGWSGAIIWSELFTLYNALCKGKEAQLPLCRPYLDYIAWLQQQDLTKAETFWRQTLKGFTAPTPLGVNKSVSDNAAQPSVYSQKQIKLSKSTTLALQTFVRQHQLTLNTLIQGVWALLLSRYSGEEDVVFGTTVSGRPAALAGVETMVGLFINTLPVRVQATLGEMLIPWLQALQRQHLEVRQYDHTPLVQIQGWSDVPRGLPLFESLLVFENYPTYTSTSNQDEHLLIQSIPAYGRTNYPLDLAAEPGEELCLTIGYDCSRFEAHMIQRMLGHLQSLLEGIAANPNQRLGDLPLLTAVERHQILVEWNETKQEYPQEKCVHQLFEEQVERTPDAIAVVFEDQQLTYQELNEHANRLATNLLEHKIGRESYVPLLMDRSIEVVISILGIMKTGAAFVPVAIDWPFSRLKQILSELNSNVILINKSAPYELQALDKTFLYVDSNVVKKHIPNLNKKVLPKDPIYVIYTSGSTGIPKGAINLHQGIMNRLFWMNKFLGSSTATTVLQTTSHLYDSAVWQLLWPLINGGKTIVLSPGDNLEASRLAILIEKYNVTMTDFVPSVFNVLVPQLVEDKNMLQKLNSIECLIIGGEEITPATIRIFHRHFPDVRILNLYGPTETSIGCICYEITGTEGFSIPIGKPISNVNTLILDQYRRLVPIGVIGEIYLSGLCLGLGYLNDEEKTKTVFVDHSFSEIGYSKLYKTGDLARYLPDGNIEFLGRIDQQVKLRGFRIELGEIEVVLSQHPNVREAIVLARENTPGEKRLVAYVVTTQEAQPNLSELRSFLRSKLPEYMVPAAFVMLEAFPLTPNGKVDRKVLPPPNDIKPKVITAPQDKLELQLLQIWQDVLNVQSISMADNFFDMGGHSLLAVRLISRIYKQLGQKLSLSVILEKPTIKELAAILRSQLIRPQQNSLITIQPFGARAPFFAVHPGSGNVMCYHLLSHYLGQEQPFYALQDPNIYNDTFLDISIEEMADQYLRELRTVQPKGPYLLGGYSFGGTVAFEMAKQLQNQGSQVAMLAILDTIAPDFISHSEDNDTLLLTIITLELTRHSRNETLQSLYTELQQLPPDRQIYYAMEKIKLSKIEFPEGSYKYLNHQLQIFKSRTRVCQEYRTRVCQGYRTQPFSGKVVLFRSSELDTFDDFQEDIYHEKTLGWEKFCYQPIQVHAIPGYHDTMIAEPNVQILAKQLQSYIENVQKT